MISIMDAVFKALADASRRSLLDRLHASNGQTLSELCDGLAMTRQAVTKHLAILEAANLVTTFSTAARSCTISTRSRSIRSASDGSGNSSAAS